MKLSLKLLLIIVHFNFNILLLKSKVVSVNIILWALHELTRNSCILII